MLGCMMNCVCEKFGTAGCRASEIARTGAGDTMTAEDPPAILLSSTRKWRTLPPCLARRVHCILERQRLRVRSDRIDLGAEELEEKYFAHTVSSGAHAQVRRWRNGRTGICGFVSAGHSHRRGARTTTFRGVIRGGGGPVRRAWH